MRGGGGGGGGGGRFYQRGEKLFQQGGDVQSASGYIRTGGRGCSRQVK